MDSPQPRSRLPWLIFMVVCLLLAIAAAGTLVALMLTDDDEGIPDAIPLIGDDDDEDFERPAVAFADLEDGDVLPLAPQLIEVVAAHPGGVESVRFFIEGDDSVVTADAGGGLDNVATFTFDPQEAGDYVLVVEATAVDGTVSEPVEVEVTVEDAAEPTAARP